MISPVACAVPNRAVNAPKLSGEGRITIEGGSILSSIYGRAEVNEEYFCNYEVNPEYQAKLQATGLRLSARGPQGEVRAVEIPGHRFFVATLFQPQLSSVQPHAVLVAFLRAAGIRGTPEFRKMTAAI